MNTPEGKVKKLVRTLLNSHKVAYGLYYFMPVQTGFGKSTLDFICASKGRAFAIETKAPGKKPTDRQEIIIEEMCQAGMRVFVIDGEKGITELKAWLTGLID